MKFSKKHRVIRNSKKRKTIKRIQKGKGFFDNLFGNKQTSQNVGKAITNANLASSAVKTGIKPNVNPNIPQFKANNNPINSNLQNPNNIVPKNIPSKIEAQTQKTIKAALNYNKMPNAPINVQKIIKNSLANPIVPSNNVNIPEKEDLVGIAPEDLERPFFPAKGDISKLNGKPKMINALNKPPIAKNTAFNLFPDKTKNKTLTPPTKSSQPKLATNVINNVRKTPNRVIQNNNVPAVNNLTDMTDINAGKEPAFSGEIKNISNPLPSPNLLSTSAEKPITPKDLTPNVPSTNERVISNIGNAKPLGRVNTPSPIEPVVSNAPEGSINSPPPEDIAVFSKQETPFKPDERSKSKNRSPIATIKPTNITRKKRTIKPANVVKQLQFMGKLDTNPDMGKNVLIPENNTTRKNFRIPNTNLQLQELNKNKNKRISLAKPANMANEKVLESYYSAVDSDLNTESADMIVEKPEQIGMFSAFKNIFKPSAKNTTQKLNREVVPKIEEPVIQRKKVLEESDIMRENDAKIQEYNNRIEDYSSKLLNPNLSKTNRSEYMRKINKYQQKIREHNKEVIEFVSKIHKYENELSKKNISSADADKYTRKIKKYEAELIKNVKDFNPTVDRKILNFITGNFNTNTDQQLKKNNKTRRNYENIEYIGLGTDLPKTYSDEE